MRKALAVHVLASVTVTTYTPGLLIFIVDVVSPVFHAYVVAVVFTVSEPVAPEQSSVVPVIEALGSGLMVTLACAVAVQVFASVTVTLYVPLLLTVSVAAVLLSLHR